MSVQLGQHAETTSPAFKLANCIVQMPSIRSRWNSNSPCLGRKVKILSTEDSSYFGVSLEPWRLYVKSDFFTVTTANGCFSVKSAYNSVFDFSNSHNCQWKLIWNLDIPPKLKTFLWTMLHKKLLTNVQRVTRRFTKNATCPICHSADETLLHLLRACPRSMQIWRAFPKPDIISNSFSLDWNGWINAQLHCHPFVKTNIMDFCSFFLHHLQFGNTESCQEPAAVLMCVCVWVCGLDLSSNFVTEYNTSNVYRNRSL
ncbi:PREDICTED: uncharacterized protein LOC101293591 [Fragaria vesca subsp. vesca]